jgi:tRNA pseudouridine32 synthase/23S rRNA pseudouridine746 synthase
VPILGDDLYPDVRERALDDYRAPLQLLAAELTFTDPLTGAPHRFTTRLRLTAWSAVDVSSSEVDA